MCLVCYSESEKKTTLDQALRGVLGDQIVSKLTLIHWKLCHQTSLKQSSCMWKSDIGVSWSTGWAEGKLWWALVSYLPEYWCSYRRYVTLTCRKDNEWGNIFKLAASNGITWHSVIPHIICIALIVGNFQQFTFMFKRKTNMMYDDDLCCMILPLLKW